MKKKFPRYFTRVGGFSDGTRYVRCDKADQSTLIMDDGTELLAAGYRLEDCVSRVKAGQWKEDVPPSVEKVSA